MTEGTTTESAGGNSVAETTNQAPATTTTENTTPVNDGAANTSGTEVDPITGATTPPAYTPNFKFKYFDSKEAKQMEKEFDEYVRGGIKDADTEKKVRDLYERAYGLDAAKTSREKYRTEAEAARTEIKDTKKALSTLSSFVASGDMQSFFEALKINEDQVLRYAQERLQYREWTPQQRAEYDQLRSTKARAEFLAEQNQTLEQKYNDTQAQYRTQELDRNLEDPNVQSVAQAFDERMGTPGAFKQEVIRRGQFYWHQYQQDIPVSQAVNEVLRIAGGMTPQALIAPAQQTPSGPSPAPEKKPTIPNIQGTGTSPAKKLPKSIEDLKKMRAAFN